MGVERRRGGWFAAAGERLYQVQVELYGGRGRVGGQTGPVAQPRLRHTLNALVRGNKVEGKRGQGE